MVQWINYLQVGWSLLVVRSANSSKEHLWPFATENFLICDGGGWQWCFFVCFCFLKSILFWRNAPFFLCLIWFVSLIGGQCSSSCQPHKNDVILKICIQLLQKAHLIFLSSDYQVPYMATAWRVQISTRAFCLRGCHSAYAVVCKKILFFVHKDTVLFSVVLIGAFHFQKRSLSWCTTTTHQLTTT